MCRGPEIELVDKDEDVTTILVDDDKWDELASDTPQGAYSRKPIATLCFAMFANSVALTNVFPYAGFMILHYGLTADETSRLSRAIHDLIYGGRLLSCSTAAR